MVETDHNDTRIGEIDGFQVEALVETDEPDTIGGYRSFRVTSADTIADARDFVLDKDAVRHVDAGPTLAFSHEGDETVFRCPECGDELTNEDVHVRDGVCSEHYQGEA